MHVALEVAIRNQLSSCEDKQDQSVVSIGILYVYVCVLMYVLTYTCVRLHER